MQAILLLEDGSSFYGVSAGSVREKIGEVILYTGVVGYQEVLTDPANAGRIIVFTYPLLGNYGTARKFNESDKCQVKAAVVKEISPMYSNWQGEDNLNGFLSESRCIMLSGVDTRTLAVKIRESGEMAGIISGAGFDKKDLLEKLKNRKRKKQFIKDVSVKRAKKVKGDSSGVHLAVIDLGMPKSFISQLKELGCNLTLLPYDTMADKIFALEPDGVIISGGPEGDEAISGISDTAADIMGKIPVLGISTGAEVIYLALGWKLKKMKTGHHGLNYPVIAPPSFSGKITTQNHSYVLDEASIKQDEGMKITLRNANDESVEEVRSFPLRFIASQYYPARPGAGEVNELFTRFLETMKCPKEKTSKKY